RHGGVHRGAAVGGALLVTGGRGMLVTMPAMAAPDRRMPVTRWPPMDRVSMNARPPAVSGMWVHRRGPRRGKVGAVVHPLRDRAESARECGLRGIDNSNVQGDQ